MTQEVRRGWRGTPRPGQRILRARVGLQTKPSRRTRLLSFSILNNANSTHSLKAFSLERPVVYGWCEVSMRTKTVCVVENRLLADLGCGCFLLCNGSERNDWSYITLIYSMCLSRECSLGVNDAIDGCQLGMNELTVLMTPVSQLSINSASRTTSKVPN